MRDPHFFQNCGSFQYNISWFCFDVSWCCIENYHNFERIEDHATVFLKWTDFTKKYQIQDKEQHERGFLNKICSFWTSVLAWSSFLLASLLLLTARSVSVCHPIQVVSVCERGSTVHRAGLLLVKTCKPWLLWTQSHQMGKNEVLG